MKKSILILGFASTLVLSSCGNRQTDKEDDVQLEAESQQVTPEENRYQTSGESTTENPENLAAINSAKKIINDYFSALERGDVTEAYEELAKSSDRGTSSEFAEKNANIETVMVSFTEEPNVTMQGATTAVKLPVRYTIKTKNGNTETYNGHAMISKTGEDGDFKIDGMMMSREEN